MVEDLLLSLVKEHGASLVLATHNLGFAKRCDRVLHLHDRKLYDALKRSLACCRSRSEKIPTCGDHAILLAIIALLLSFCLIFVHSMAQASRTPMRFWEAGTFRLRILRRTGRLSGAIG
jgi:energy-coupling factor transporter ATP-binding protein EcfA2